MDALAGRVAVVTGGASGIGRALAVALDGAGCDVVLADVEKVALDETVDDMRARGSSAIGVACDVRSKIDMEALAQEARTQFGPVDIVCLNAGVSPSGSVLDTSVETWRWLIDVNLMGVVNGLTAFVPDLVRRRSGHVVITGSLAGLIPTPSLGPYSAVKHALTGLAEVLRTELVDTGVHVSLVCPGVVQTRIAESERNRPSAFPGASHSDADLAQRYKEAVATSTTTPAHVAAEVLQALIEHRFLVLPSPEGPSMVTQRLEELRSAIES